MHVTYTTSRTWFSIFLLSLCTFVTAAPGGDFFDVSQVTTSLHFYPHFLEKSGLALVYQEPSANPRRYYPGFTGYRGIAEQPFGFVAQGGDFEQFREVGPALVHDGGFVLTYQDTLIDLTRFRLVPEPGVTVFSLRDTADRNWFTMSFPHSELLLGHAKLELRHMDLAVGPALAELMERPDLIGFHIGIAEVEMAVTVPDSLYKGLQACEGIFEGDIDIELTDISFVGLLTANSQLVALAPSAELRNVGVADVPWFRAIEPDGVVGEHPYLVMNMYRLHEGRFEQIGASDVKHAFFAINSGCDCPGAQILYAGCSDLYAASTNGDFTHLAPRDEIHAFSGAWTSEGSHFDGEPVDNRRDHFSRDHEPFDHRLVVTVDELSTEGARYFVDAWYVVGKDINLFNNMGFREVRPALNGALWSFTVTSAHTIGSVLDAWVDPLEPGENATHQVIDTGEGRYSIASRVEAVAETNRYHYTLFNHDFDRQLNSFHLPLPPDFVTANLVFLDGDQEQANDWTPEVMETGITWRAPEGNGLDWGRMISFSLDNTLSFQTGDGQVTYLEEGETSEANVPLMLPFCRAESQWQVQLPNWPTIKVTALVADRETVCAPIPE